MATAEHGCQSGSSFVNIGAALASRTASVSTPVRTPRTPARVVVTSPEMSDDCAEEGNFLSEVVIAKWAPSFALFDRDSSGTISAAELEREFAEFGEVLDPGAAAAMVKAGAVDKARFAALMEAPFKSEAWSMAQAVS